MTEHKKINIAVGQWLLLKPINSAIVVLVAALMPLFGVGFIGFIVAGVVTGLVTLQKGVKAGALLLAWAALPSVALLWLGRVDVLDVVFLQCVLIWMMACVLGKYASWQLVFELLVVLAIVAIVSLHLIVPDVHQMWYSELMKTAERLQQITGRSLDVIQLHFKSWAYVASGMAAAEIMFVVILQLILARAWQSGLYNAGGFSGEFRQLRMGYVSAGLMLLVIIASGFKWVTAWDLLPVVIFPFFWAGLSLAHNFIVSLTRKTIGWFILLYAGIVLLWPYILFVLSLFGLLDVRFNFRKKLTN